MRGFRLKCLSLFSGIGGFDLALKNLGHEIVGACEIDKYARQIYARHFPGVPIHEDATKINPDNLPDFDILVGGFPCQAFSVAGKQRGFDDTRGTLFFEIARIAQQKRPRYLLLENVKGLLSHERGSTIRTIFKTLDELGYDTQARIINSKDFVPQNRERIFIIGHLRGTSRPKVFPLGESSPRDDKKTDKSIQRPRPYSTAIDANYYKGPDGKRTMIAIPVLTPDRPIKRQNGRRFKTDGEPSFTLTAQDKHGIYDGMKIRLLTPLECERLQGFPDLWTDVITGKSKAGFDNHMSDTQRYKCCGNAVTVPVVEYIISKLALPMIN